MSGVQIIEILKKNFPDVRVIIISAQDDPKIASEFTKHGIYGYIVKNTEWKDKLSDYIQELNL
jgi:DNA-binding NarL/FixJ family response regulator